MKKPGDARLGSSPPRAVKRATPAFAGGFAGNVRSVDGEELLRWGTA